MRFSIDTMTTCYTKYSPRMHQKELGIKYIDLPDDYLVTGRTYKGDPKGPV